MLRVLNVNGDEKMNYQPKAAMPPIIAALIGVASTFLPYVTNGMQSINIWSLNEISKSDGENLWITYFIGAMVIIFGICIIAASRGTKASLFFAFIVAIIGSVLGVLQLLIVQFFVFDDSSYGAGIGVYLPVIVMIAVSVLSMRTRKKYI